MLTLLFIAPPQTSVPPVLSVLRRLGARDTVLGQFKTAWDADPESSLIPVYYWDQKRNRPADDLEPFVRINMVHATGFQASLARDTGTIIYGREGIIQIQIFTPLGKGLTQADSLAKVAADAFEGQNNGDIWFRNVRINEIGPDGDRFQTNVLIDFTYDEIK